MRHYHYLHLVSLVLFFNFCKIQLINSQVIDYTTTIKIVKGVKIMEKQIVAQINNSRQNWLGEVAISHDTRQQFNLVEAHIVGPNGDIVRKLKKKEVLTKSLTSSEAFYYDDLVSEFVLNWHEYPYQVKYKYTLTETEFINIIKWQPVIYRNVTTLNAFLRIETPLEYEIIVDYPEGIYHRNYIEKGVHIYTWHIGNYHVPKTGLYSPPILELLPTVTVVPKEFTYVIKGGSGSWALFGNWLSKLNAGSTFLPAIEKRKVHALTEGINDKKEIAKVLYHYLQDNTRYINVAIDVGGLKPYPASYVCTNKYGDCKALTVYMQALLKEAGIPSFYTVIKANKNPEKINIDMPSQQFDHVVLVAPIGKDTLWFENTVSYLPFNYVGTFTQNRYALLVNGEKSRLVRTPKLRLEEVIEKSIYQYMLDEEGIGTLVIKKELKGDTFESYRFYHHNLSEKEFEKVIVHDINLKGFTLEKWYINNFNRDALKLQVKLIGSCENQIRNVANMKVIYPEPLPIPTFENPGMRKQPVRINFPINKQDSITYELPFLKDYTVEIPNDTLIATPYGMYSEKYFHRGNSISVSRSFQLYAADYQLGVYRDFFAFIESVLTVQKRPAIVLIK